MVQNPADTFEQLYIRSEPLCVSIYSFCNKSNSYVCLKLSDSLYAHRIFCNPYSLCLMDITRFAVNCHVTHSPYTYNVDSADKKVSLQELTMMLIFGAALSAALSLCFFS